MFIRIVSCFRTNLFVVFLQSGKIFAGFRKLALFHTLTNIPVNKSALRIHEIEFVVNAAERFGNGSCVGYHAHCTLDFSQITARNHLGRLVVDTALKTSGAPVYELDGALCLDCSNRCVDVLGNNITAKKNQ